MAETSSLQATIAIKLIWSADGFAYFHSALANGIESTSIVCCRLNGLAAGSYSISRCRSGNDTWIAFHCFLLAVVNAPSSVKNLSDGQKRFNLPMMCAEAILRERDR